MADDARRRDFSSDQSSNSAREPSNDPLAELARLIGQNDPFHDLGKRGAARNSFDNVRATDRPAPEWLARPAASHDREEDWAQQPAQDSYQAERGEATHYASAADYRVPSPGSYADETRHAGHDAHADHDYAASGEHDAYPGDDRYRVTPPSGDYDEGYYDGHLPPQGDEGPVAVKRRGGLVTIAAVIGLAVVGTAGAFGYRAYTSGSGSSASPPVIKADTAPVKTVPPAPAAAPSADAQGKPFQDRIGAVDTATRTAPREEQPVSLPAPQRMAASGAPTLSAPPSAQSASPLVPPMPAPSSMNEPKRVKTIAIRPPESGGTSDPAPGAMAPSAPARQPAAKQSGQTPMAINPPSDPPARTKSATRTPPSGQAAGGAYVVQVSAQRTEAEAESSYRALQQKHPSVLGGREANYRRVDLADKGGVFYRAQVGSFATSEQATAFCESLKSAGGQCIVQRN